MTDENKRGSPENLTIGTAEKLTRRDMLPLMAGMAVSGAAVSLSAQARPSEAATRKRPAAEDRLDILELFARYSWYYDCSDVEGYVSTFTPDGIIEAFGSEAARGRDAIRKFVRDLFESERGEAVWQHLNNHHVFEGDGKNCRVYSYWTLVETRPEGGPGVRSTGYYVTDCRKLNGGWYISRRSISRWDRDKVPWKQN